MVRVALLTNEITPYRVSLYCALAGTPGWEFRVMYCAEREIGRSWESSASAAFQRKKSRTVSCVRHIHHRGPAIYSDDRMVHIPVGLLHDLSEYRPDVVISGEMGARTLIAAAYAWTRHKPLLIWFYGTAHTERHSSVAQRLLRSFLVWQAKAFVGMGTDARRYLCSLGVRPDRVFDAPNGEECAHWAGALSPDVRESVRARHGVQGLCYLYVGRMIPLKGLEDLLRAWSVFQRGLPGAATLMLVGDGGEERRLRDIAGRLCGDSVRFVGFTERAELPALYQAADVFVMPSLQDAWSRVMGEAMASGLPVLASRYDGSTADLVVEGKNGWTFDPLNEPDIVAKLRLAWDSRTQLETMGACGREVIARMDTECMANGFRRAVECALSEE